MTHNINLQATKQPFFFDGQTREIARYMTVYRPYPMNANWELPSDVIAFAFWIAGCIGVEPLWGVHYKPKASRLLCRVAERY